MKPNPVGESFGFSMSPGQEAYDAELTAIAYGLLRLGSSGSFLYRIFKFWLLLFHISGLNLGKDSGAGFWFVIILCEY